MDNIFERPEGEKPYKSLHKHFHNSADDDSKWISREIEERVFNNADYGTVTGEEPEEEEANDEEIEVKTGFLWLKCSSQDFI